MFPSIIKNLFQKSSVIKNGISLHEPICKFCTSLPQISKNEAPVAKNIELSDIMKTLPNDTDKCLDTTIETSRIKDLESSTVRDYSNVYPYIKTGSIFASYIDDSDFLKELLRLGVNFYELEKNLDAVEFILRFRFEDIREHIIFLREHCVEKSTIGKIITKNPFILKEDIDDLKVRVNYLQFKRFTDDMIVRIIESNPKWLSYSTQEIDDKLGFFQNNFKLKGQEVRFLASKSPRLITWDLEKVKLNIFVLQEEMGLLKDEMKKIILDKPKIYMMNQNKLLKTFDYVHNTMKIPIERIVEEPEILTCRQSRLMQRHLFLAKLGKAQFDPKKPNYIALTTLVSGTDSHFSTEVAKSSIQTYNEFLKWL